MPRFATVVLVDRRGWLLLQERDEHPVIAPDCWSFCGGHVEDGEDVEVAAYRELEEETGVVLPPGTLRLLGDYAVFHAAYDSLDPMSVYLARADLTDADIDCREGRQIVFVDPATLASLELSEAAEQILPDVVRTVAAGDLPDPPDSPHPPNPPARGPS